VTYRERQRLADIQAAVDNDLPELERAVQSLTANLSAEDQHEYPPGDLSCLSLTAITGTLWSTAPDRPYPTPP
jgi:hypothetical protein